MLECKMAGSMEGKNHAHRIPPHKFGFCSFLHSCLAGNACQNSVTLICSPMCILHRGFYQSCPQSVEPSMAFTCTSPEEGDNPIVIVSCSAFVTDCSEVQDCYNKVSAETPEDNMTSPRHALPGCDCVPGDFSSHACSCITQ